MYLFLCSYVLCSNGHSLLINYFLNYCKKMKRIYEYISNKLRHLNRLYLVLLHRQITSKCLTFVCNLHFHMIRTPREVETSIFQITFARPRIGTRKPTKNYYCLASGHCKKKETATGFGRLRSYPGHWHKTTTRWQINRKTALVIIYCALNS